MKKLISVGVLLVASVALCWASSLRMEQTMPDTGPAFEIFHRQTPIFPGAGASTGTNSSIATIPASLNTLLSNLWAAVPFTTNIATATVEIPMGAILRNGFVENFVDAHWNIHTNFVVFGGIENAPSSSVIDRASLLGGLRYPWQNFEMGAGIGGLWNWTPDSLSPRTGFQGKFEFFTSTQMPGNMWLFFKADILTDRTKPFGQAPPMFFGGGLTLALPHS